MKLVLVLLLIPLGTIAQQWQTIPHEHYNVPLFSGGFMPSINYSQFEINPFDGSMWFINNLLPSNFDIKRISTDGSMIIFDPSNNPFMDNNSRYNYGLEFVNSAAYVLHGFDGVYRCDDVTWSTVAGGIDGGLNMCSDGDTIHFVRQNQDFVSIKAGVLSFNNWSNFKRIQSRNGSIWGSGAQSSGIVKYLPVTSSIQIFDPTTCPLLDNSNHDFKFAPNSDTLYVAGEQGFSLAFDDQFVDTITMNNCSGMPYPSIIEFEFDSQDNIWAVFGDGGAQGFYPMYIAYYDRNSHAWSMIYDENNSPIDFTKRIDIEIDLNDNVWVCDGIDLHVLKINSTPSWLSIIENEQQAFSIHPNPSQGTFNIKTEIAQNISELLVFDLLGKEVIRSNYESSLTLDLNSGSYVVILIDERGTSLGRNRVIVE